MMSTFNLYGCQDKLITREEKNAGSSMCMGGSLG
jgi:hypothetical protein